MTTPADTAAYVAAAVRGYLAAAGMYLAAVVQQNPGLSISHILQREDVAASLVSAFGEARDYVTEAVQEQWDKGGAAEDAVYDELMRDTAAIFSRARQAHLRALLREEGETGDVRGVVEQFGRQLALRASMAAQHAGSASALQAVLTGASQRPDAALLRKRWKAHPENPSCCFWCRRLNGVTIKLYEDFTPYLGGPAALSGTGRLTQPPKPYGGRLKGPLLHPWCNCELEIITVTGEEDVSSETGQAGSTALPYLASSHIREMSSARYRVLIEFLRAAAHELGMVLERLRRGR